MLRMNLFVFNFLIVILFCLDARKNQKKSRRKDASPHVPSRPRLSVRPTLLPIEDSSKLTEQWLVVVTVEIFHNEPFAILYLKEVFNKIGCV